MKKLGQYIKWAWGTTWPLYALSVLIVNVVGALALATFLRFLVPLGGAQELVSVTTTTATLAVSLEALGWTQTEWDDPTITE